MNRSIVLQAAVKPLPLQAKAIDATRWMDAIAVALLVLVAAIAAATFRDYGLGWDDYAQSQYGRLLISLYSSGFADKRALSYINIYMYGGGFDMLATLAAKVLPFGLFETRRLVGAVIGIVGLFVTWRLGRRLGGPLAGLIALVLLAACPLYYGHMFINCKDAPFATAMVLALLAIVRAFEEYPKATPATIALTGVSFGLAIGTRVLGGFAVLEALLPLCFVIAIKSRALGLRKASGECAQFLLPFIPGMVLACLVMGLVWPWSVVSPFNVFHALEYFSHDFEEPWQELFDGRLIPINAMPASYAPTLFAVQLPELLLGLGIAGCLGALVATVRGEAERGGIGRRPAFVAIVLAVVLPLLLIIATRPYIDNGIRQLLFIVPPFAVLAGLAAAWIWRRLAQRGRPAMTAGALALLAGTISPVIDMVRLHPYEYTDFNHIIGGVRGARPLFLLDYWGLSMRQASQQLVALLAQRHETPPNGKWTFAVCGPEPPAAVALGPAFTFAPSPQADFALSLGEFYCAKLDVPLLVQVVRDGVVFARVYDIRGRSMAKLTVK